MIRANHIPAIAAGGDAAFAFVPVGPCHVDLLRPEVRFRSRFFAFTRDGTGLLIERGIEAF